MPPTQIAVAKQKTKAKKRYLKAKKERKKRKAAAGKPAASGDVGVPDAVRQDGHGDDDNDDSKSDDSKQRETSARTDNRETERRQRNEGLPPKKKKRHSKGKNPEESAEGDVDVARPRKRRKLDSGELSLDTTLSGSPSAAHSPSEPSSPPPSSSDLPTEPNYLGRRTPPLPSQPTFPVPSRPDAPEISELASQGLDRALARAQLVDPQLSTPLPLDEDQSADIGLSVKTLRRLKELGITELFAVQTTLLPMLLPPDRLKRSLYLPYDPPSDICVSAPTGSGKTLAYVLPIVETLSSRAVTRLRALVVLPTRDLVVQVRETFEAIAKGRGLKIGSVTGQHPFSHEQAQLVNKEPTLHGGSSKVDILICTPGRLMDHMSGTPNFSLQHLRFLVIDEADRLLAQAQSFQNWLAQVLAATRPPACAEAETKPREDRITSIPYPDALSPAFLHLLGGPVVRADIDEKRESSCQKLLFSATLMNDPGRIAALDLRTPRYVVVQSAGGVQESDVLGVAMERFSMPATLKEHMIVCDSSQKPLILFHLVHSIGVTNALVFTKSAESTQRLVQLFEFFEVARSDSQVDATQNRKSVVVRAYSSDLSAVERKSILEKFKAQEIEMLVCSDLVSRGMDIKHVEHVINYDAPVDMRKYVHRVGRTARAGRTGEAWTLVGEQEARYFKNMIRSADRAATVNRLRVTERQLAPLIPFYRVALAGLKDVFS
ncbi:DEAD-domain-containing protein [Lactarius hatsudake]|nr:DEAD-domain-containing protein [Lactarius hatsudake]